MIASARRGGASADVLPAVGAVRRAPPSGVAAAPSGANRTTARPGVSSTSPASIQCHTVGPTGSTGPAEVGSGAASVNRQESSTVTASVTGSSVTSRHHCSSPATG